MPEDILTQFMSMMRFAEEMKRRREADKERGAGIGRMATTPGLRERVEDAPKDMRGSVIDQIMEAMHVPQEQRGQGRTYLSSPSRRTQEQHQKFSMDNEKVKAKLEELRNEPDRQRAMMEATFGDQLDKKKMDMLHQQLRQKAHNDAREWMQMMSVQAEHLLELHPDDPMAQKIREQLKGTTGMSGSWSGAEEGLRPGGAPQQPAVGGTGGGRMGALQQLIGMGGPGTGVMKLDEEAQ